MAFLTPGLAPGAMPRMEMVESIPVEVAKVATDPLAPWSRVKHSHGANCGIDFPPCLRHQRLLQQCLGSESAGRRPIQSRALYTHISSEGERRNP